MSATHAAVAASPRAVLILANAASGSLRQQHKSKLAEVAQHFQRLNVPVTTETVAGSDLEQRSADAVKAGCRTIVAAGGDGTISCIARALVGTATRLGVVPLGTYNHFARDLGVPPEIEAAVQLIALEHERLVDVGEVNGFTFLNNASMGIYPAMVIDRDRQAYQHGRAKWWAMLLAAWRVMRRFPLLQVRLSLGAQAPWCTTPLVFVGNNPYRFDLLAFGSRPSLDHGRLSLYAAQATTRMAMLRLGLKAVIGRLADDQDAITNELEEFWIHSRRRRLAVGLDGEVVRLTPPLHFRIRPKELRVLGPG